jgi:hypothetical protein
MKPVGAVSLGAAASFSVGVGQIWLSSVQCSGSESHLVDCTSSSGAQDYRCYHSADAGVRCQANSSGKEICILDSQG